MKMQGLGGLWIAPAVVWGALVYAPALQAQESRSATPVSIGGSPAGSASGPAATPAFEVDIVAPPEIEDLLRRHLELMRYRALPDLDNTELERLLLAARGNTRELLATQGYFSPEINVALSPASPRRATITVSPGPPTQVDDVTITFIGDIVNNDAAAAQRSTIRAGWPLRSGMRFTQAAWDDAKTQALRLLGAQRYPVGQIATSIADIDPLKQTARLSVTLDSGAAFRLGGLQVQGLERYDSALVERLARLRTGAEYDESGFLEAQQRLQDSGYFDSVFLSLDTSGDPLAAPVVVTLREAKLQRLVLGIGASTDAGPRLSVEHTHHRLPGIGWRAVSKLLLDRETQSIGTELTSMPDAGNWRWVVAGQLKNENAASVEVQSQSLRGGRSQLGDRIDRAYYLQYDRANTTDLGVQTRAQAISANYAWTQRNFDSLPFPSAGYGLGVELGGGMTLGDQRDPFLRTQLHWLGVWSLADRAQPGSGAGTRAGRIAVRAQAGAVVARDSAVLPSTQLFLAGGDASVRGYDYHDIGVVRANGQTTPGRYLAAGSVEWQRPITLAGSSSDWESTLFIDAGAVADQPSQLKAKVGIGSGIRWKSPVGPLQMDLAYGVAVKKFRLHLSVGFTF